MNDMTPFDYAGVPVEHAQSVRDAATRIKCRMARTALDIIEIGRDLIEVKKAMGHGHFMNWIEAEFGMSRQSADRFMQAADAFPDSKALTVSTLPPTVLYALSAPSTSDEVRQAVVEKAAAGEKVTPADVKELKAKLADKDDKLRTLKTQKQSADAHNNRLIDEVRSKTNECHRLNENLGHLREEVRRLTEPGTITLPPVDAAKPAPLSPVPQQHLQTADISAWQSMMDAIWSNAPSEARDWIREFVAERS